MTSDSGMLKASAHLTQAEILRSRKRDLYHAHLDRWQPKGRTTSPPIAPLVAAIRAEPFTWIDPATIPMREWVYGRHYIRRFVSVTVAPGGVGKSSLAIAEAMAMASGRGILGDVPSALSKVWIWNGEDPLDELQRRIMATAVYYGFDRSDFEGRLFANSGRTTEIVIAEQVRQGVMVAVPVVDAVKATIFENGIDVVVIDPFVSSHRVTENDNNAIDRVVKTWARIAEETNCAVELVHHSRKTYGREVEVEDGRGAVALLAAARAARVLNPMTEEEAQVAGIERRRLHFRVDDGKANLAPPAEHSTWYRLASVDLGNGHMGSGDSIGVVTPFAYRAPDALDGVSVADLNAVQAAIGNGRWRASVQARNWAGVAVADALGLDLAKPGVRAKVKRLLQIWIGSGALLEVDCKDEDYKVRPFVEIGEGTSD